MQVLKAPIQRAVHTSQAQLLGGVELNNPDRFKTKLPGRLVEARGMQLLKAFHYWGDPRPQGFIRYGSIPRGLPRPAVISWGRE